MNFMIVDLSLMIVAKSCNSRVWLVEFTLFVNEGGIFTRLSADCTSKAHAAGQKGARPDQAEDQIGRGRRWPNRESIRSGRGLAQANQDRSMRKSSAPIGKAAPVAGRGLPSLKAKA